MRMATSFRWRADARNGPAGACLLILAGVLAACGATSPSTEPPTGSRVPAACIGLEVAQCELVLAALADELPGATPTYVAISERLCDGPCPGSERGLWLGQVMVEFSDGRKPATILIEVDGDAVAWNPIESGLVEVTPRSARLTGPTTELTLGHCGLSSGIDVDGAFWDPIGMIDAGDPALINTAAARFTLASPERAVLVTEAGTVLRLARHTGPKHLPGCY